VWHTSVPVPTSLVPISWSVDRGYSLSQVTVATDSRDDAALTIVMKVRMYALIVIYTDPKRALIKS